MHAYPAIASVSQPWQGFRDNLNYTSVDAMVANGWTRCGQGSSQIYDASRGALTLENGAAMCWSNIPTGVQNWTFTARGQWAQNQNPSSGVQIIVQTAGHVYRLAAGESPNRGIVVYRDGVAIMQSGGWYPYCVVDGRYCYYTDYEAWDIYSLNMAGGVLTAYFNNFANFADGTKTVGTYKEPDSPTDLVMVSPSSGSDIGVVWSYVTAAPFDPTYTSVVCTPSSVAVNKATVCTATVANTFAKGVIPTGTVSFTVSGTCFTNGVYWTCPIPISSCTLSNLSADSADCSISYKSTNCPCYDWQTSPGMHTITATYNGDQIHPSSTGTFNLAVTPLATTVTNLNCNPSTISVGETSTCTATVTDTSSNPTVPTGQVSAGVPGTFCTLGNPTTRSARCSFPVKAYQSGSITVAAPYSGDSSHYQSDGAFEIIVNSSPPDPQFQISVVHSLDNELYWDKLSSGIWTGWQSLSGETPSPPVVCSSGTIMILAVRGMDNGIYLETYTNNNWSNSWDSPGGATNDQPACAVLDQTLYVVVRGLNNVTYANSMSLATLTWSGWVDLGGQTPSAPVIVVTSSANRLDLVVRGLANGIFHKAVVNGAWTPAWDSPGGATPDIPGAASDAAALNVVVRGMDNALWHNSYNFAAGSWSNWFSIGGTTLTAPSIAVDSSGTLHLQVTGLANSIWHISRTPAGVWGSNWDSPGGTTQDRPVLVRSGTGVAVMVRGMDNNAYLDILDQSVWSGWTGLGETTNSPPAFSSL